MKGENEFIYFLVGGLLIIAILMIFLGADIYKTGANRPPGGIIEAVKTFSIPDFEASNILEKRGTALVSKSIYNGLLFGEDKIIYNLSKSDLQDVTVKFTVRDTNALGRLRVTANGAIIATVTQPGDYEIGIPAEAISDHTVIEIASESSYWKIWAPALYYIDFASITFTSYSQEDSQFKFYLGEEYLNLVFAKIDLVLSENIGALAIDVNGQNVWDSPLADLQTIRLDKSQLRLGDNIITLRAGRNTRISGTGTIAVVFLTQYPELINQSGIVTAKQPLTGSTGQFYG